MSHQDLTTAHAKGLNSAWRDEVQSVIHQRSRIQPFNMGLASMLAQQQGMTILDIP